MPTITINNQAYNNALRYAEEQRIGVDELIVALINKLSFAQKAKGHFELLPVEQLAPELQDIISMPRKEFLADDALYDDARMDYFREKLDL